MTMTVLLVSLDGYENHHQIHMIQGMAKSICVEGKVYDWDGDRKAVVPRYVRVNDDGHEPLPNNIPGFIIEPHAEGGVSVARVGNINKRKRFETEVGARKQIDANRHDPEWP